jgi:hypothetical protein
MKPSRRGNASYIPSDANGKSAFRPVSAFNDRHLSSHIASRSVKDLVGMAVVGGGEVVRVAMAGMEVHAVVGVHSRHDERLGI